MLGGWVGGSSFLVCGSVKVNLEGLIPKTTPCARPRIRQALVEHLHVSRFYSC